MQSEALEDTKSIQRIEISLLFEAVALQRDEGKTENTGRCGKRRDSKQSADANLRKE